MSTTTPHEPPCPVETYTLDQLADMADLPVRTIRYYIQRGLVSRPEGEKKGAYYLRTHLEQLLQIRKWVGAGMSLDRAAALLHGEPDKAPSRGSNPAHVPITRREVSVYSLADGLELVIDPLRCSLPPADISRLLKLLETTLTPGASAPAIED